MSFIYNPNTGGGSGGGSGTVTGGVSENGNAIFDTANSTTDTLAFNGLASGTNTTISGGGSNSPLKVNVDLSAYTTTAGLGSMAFANTASYTPTAGFSAVAFSGAYSDLSGTPTFSNLSPMTTKGDIIYEDGTLTPVRLPIGSNTNLLSITSGIPAWVTQSSLSLAYTQITGTPTLGTISSHSSSDYLPIGGGTLTGALTLNADPTTALGAATKAYVDAVTDDLDFKTACYAATTANLNATYVNSAGTLTNAGSLAAFSIDSVSPPANSRILVKDQTSSFQNGIYVVTTVGSGATAWVLTRSQDFNTAPSEIYPGNLVSINNGTVNSGYIYEQTATVNTIGTDAITWAIFNYKASAYLLSSNNLSDVSNTATAYSNLAPYTTLGDLVYEDATPKPTRLPGNTSSTKKFLTQTGNGTTSAAPSWGTIANTDVSGLGTLSTQNGTFSGTSSGTNTGDQTITLTSDVTGSGSGSFATTISANAVTYAKMQAASANSIIIGSQASGSKALQEITLGTNLSMSGTTLNATGGGSFSVASMGPAPITNKFYPIMPNPFVTFTSVTTGNICGAGMFAGTTHTFYIPVYIPFTSITIKTYNLLLNTAPSTAVSLNFAFYNIDANQNPTGAPITNSSYIGLSTGTTSSVVLTATLANSLTLTGGLYYMGIQTSSSGFTPVITCFSGFGANQFFPWSSLATSSTFLRITNCFEDSNAYSASVMPTVGSLTTIANNTSTPNVWPAIFLGT